MFASLGAGGVGKPVEFFASHQALGWNAPLRMRIDTGKYQAVYSWARITKCAIPLGVSLVASRHLAARLRQFQRATLNLDRDVECVDVVVGQHVGSISLDYCERSGDDAG
ncbi:hypothetical protein WL21_32665 [Burkholderia ubonensis]|nr:hypothetical protein WJ81_02595 [Burkholderia ubonensis]KVZ58444.1 hypothetical protein WL20_22250 [Burkholderia ubonensis]KVZ75161.1 hypothetical protein WL21_32665 [Burkholderia ubonensis]